LILTEIYEHIKIIKKGFAGSYSTGENYLIQVCEKLISLSEDHKKNILKFDPVRRLF